MIQKLMFYTVNTGIIAAYVLLSHWLPTKSERMLFQSVLRDHSLGGKLTPSCLRERYLAVHSVQLRHTKSSLRRHG